MPGKKKGKAKPPRIITDINEELRRELGNRAMRDIEPLNEPPPPKPVRRPLNFEELMEMTTQKPTFSSRPSDEPPLESQPFFFQNIGGGPPVPPVPQAPNILSGIGAVDIARLGQEVSRAMATASVGTPFDPEEARMRALLKRIERETQVTQDLLINNTDIDRELKRARDETYKLYLYGGPSNQTEMKIKAMKKLFPPEIINKYYRKERAEVETDPGELQGPFGRFVSR